MRSALRSSVASVGSAPTVRLAISRKCIALVCDSGKRDLLDRWVRANRSLLRTHDLVAAEPLGPFLERQVGRDVTTLRRGSFGELQLTKMIADGAIDLLVYFIDPLSSVRTGPETAALWRMAVAFDLPTACNRRTADALVAQLLRGPGTVAAGASHQARV